MNAPINDNVNTGPIYNHSGDEENYENQLRYPIRHRKQRVIEGSIPRDAIDL